MNPTFMLSTITTAILLAGCTTPKYGVNERIKAVDRLAQIQEEYGSVTMSPPILVPSKKAGEYFAFDLEHQNSEQYFADAKKELQGRAANAESYSDISNSSIGLQANLDQFALGRLGWQKYLLEQNDYLRQKAIYESNQQFLYNLKQDTARRTLQLALTEANKKTTETERTAAVNAAYEQYTKDQPSIAAPGAAPTLPSIDDKTLPALPTASETPPQKTHPDKTKEIRDYLALLTPNTQAPTQNSNRTAIITAAGDNTVEGIFRVLGDVGKAQLYEDKYVFYGVAQVSVQPGWRTRHDFEANLKVLPKLVYVNARASLQQVETAQPPDKGKCEEIKSTYAPLISAVTPMTDIQNMELGNSRRQYAEHTRRISAALSLAGVKIGADSFKSYAEKLESDILTHTPLVPISAYSNGGVFGYKIGPSVVALTNPGNPKSGSGELLQKQSFPTLFVIGFNKSELQLKKTSDGKTECKPQIQLTQMPSWTPINEAASAHRLNNTELVYLRDIIEVSSTPDSDTDAAARKKKYKQSSEPSLMEKTANYLSVQDESWRHTVLGSEVTLEIPDTFFSTPNPQPPQDASIPMVKDVLLMNLQAGTGKSIEGVAVLTGTGLEKVDLSNIKPSNSDVAITDTKTFLNSGIRLNFSINKPGRTTFEMTIKGGESIRGAILSPIVEIKLPEIKVIEPNQAADSNAVSYQVVQNNKKVTHEVKFSGTLNQQELDISKNVLQSELEKNKPLIKQSIKACCKE